MGKVTPSGKVSTGVNIYDEEEVHPFCFHGETCIVGISISCQ